MTDVVWSELPRETKDLLIDALRALLRERVNAYTLASEIAAKHQRPFPTESDYAIPAISDFIRALDGAPRLC